MHPQTTLALLSCLFLCCVSTTTHAQEQAEKDTRYVVTLEPLYLANGGLRLNVEKHLQARDWLELSATGYWLPDDPENKYNDRLYTSNSNFDYFLKLGGIGVGGSYKRYFMNACTISAGVSYTYYNVNYLDYALHPYLEDGLTYYMYNAQSKTQHFNKFTADLRIGARTSFQHLLVCEFYAGVGYAHSFYHKDRKAFNGEPFGFGFGGIYPTGGIKLGFNIR